MIPQIYYNGEYVGGYEELMSLLDTNVTFSESDECRACEG